MRKFLKQSELDKIDIKGSPRVRIEVRQDVVEEYIDNYENKVRMPDVVLFEDKPNHYLIGDGMHRVEAMRGVPTGKWVWTFDIRKGSLEDCLEFALQANVAHGLRRTNSDKRRGVVEVLHTAKFQNLSNVKIAEMACVGESMVAEIRKSLEKDSVIPAATIRKGKDGKEYRVPIRDPDAPAKPQNANKSEESGSPVSNGAAKASKDSAPAQQRCKSGAVIPMDLLPLWNRRNEVAELLEKISEVKCYVAKRIKDEDPLYAEMDNHFEVMIGNVYQTLKLAMPYAVCPTCQGKITNKCVLCKTRGFVSEFIYTGPSVKENFRKMREQMAAAPKVK